MPYGPVEGDVRISNHGDNERYLQVLCDVSDLPLRRGKEGATQNCHHQQRGSLAFVNAHTFNGEGKSV